MEENEFIILFLQASEEVKAEIRRILEANQQYSDHEE